MCWQNFADSEQSDRDLVKNAVEGSWGDVTQLEFIGWDKQCTENDTDKLRINVVNAIMSGADMAALGTLGIGEGKGFVMKLNFHDFSPSMRKLCDRYPRDQCIRAIAVHEFGHVLSFAHEFNRPDDPGNDLLAGEPFCHTKNQNPVTLTNDGQQYEFETFGNTLFTAYDPDSIMNYCRSNYGDSDRLSARDIVAAQVYYGRMPSFDVTNNQIEIPRIETADGIFKATLIPAGQGKWKIGEAERTSLGSSIEPSLSANNLHLPLVKFVEALNTVTAIWRVNLIYDKDAGTFSYSCASSSKLHPIRGRPGC